MTNSFVQDRKKSTNKVATRENSNGPQDTNSKVHIQVHNKSLQELFSPQARSSSDANPVNIVLGSASRFTREEPSVSNNK
jgi:hypothetical protein